MRTDQGAWVPMSSHLGQRRDEQAQPGWTPPAPAAPQQPMTPERQQLQTDWQNFEAQKRNPWMQQPAAPAPTRAVPYNGFEHRGVTYTGWENLKAPASPYNFNSPLVRNQLALPPEAHKQHVQRHPDFWANWMQEREQHQDEYRRMLLEQFGTDPDTLRAMGLIATPPQIKSGSDTVQPTASDMAKQAPQSSASIAPPKPATPPPNQPLAQPAAPVAPQPASPASSTMQRMGFSPDQAQSWESMVGGRPPASGYEDQAASGLPHPLSPLRHFTGVNSQLSGAFQWDPALNSSVQQPNIGNNPASYYDTNKLPWLPRLAANMGYDYIGRPYDPNTAGGSPFSTQVTSMANPIFSGAAQETNEFLRHYRPWDTPLPGGSDTSELLQQLYEMTRGQSGVQPPAPGMPPQLPAGYR